MGGVEVEQETSAPPPKKILDAPLYNVVRISQNIQNEISLEIFADVVAYQFIKLN